MLSSKIISYLHQTMKKLTLQQKVSFISSFYAKFLFSEETAPCQIYRIIASQTLRIIAVSFDLYSVEIEIQTLRHSHIFERLIGCISQHLQSNSSYRSQWDRARKNADFQAIKNLRQNFNKE